MVVRKKRAAKVSSRKRRGSLDRPSTTKSRHLPPGVRLKFKLRASAPCTGRVSWSSDGGMLASGLQDGHIGLWDSRSGELTAWFGDSSQTAPISSVAWSRDGRLLAAGSEDGTITLWKLYPPQSLHTFHGQGEIADLVWLADGRLASASTDGTIRLWDTRDASEPSSWVTDKSGRRPVQLSISGSPDARYLASSSYDLCLWDGRTGESRILDCKGVGLYDAEWSPRNGSSLIAAAASNALVLIFDVRDRRPMLQLEGHTEQVLSVAFSPDGSVLASYAGDIRFWDCETWKPMAAFSDIGGCDLSFNPRFPLLARAGSNFFSRHLGDSANDIAVWEIDFEVMRGRAAARTQAAVQHTTAKVVLVGDSGVGKTGLGWRLAHGEFKEHSSTHGQQFWILDTLSVQRSDGTQCEAILWDLAGQPDYRLTHALFLDDADLALVLFDPTDSRDPLHGVEFWLRQLCVYGSSGKATLTCSTILVGARTDRGEARLTVDELQAFCQKRGIAGGYVASSAKEGFGLSELLEKMQGLVPWDRKTSAVTTVTFKRIKDYVLELKESRRRKKVLVAPIDLRKRLQKTDRQWKFDDKEMMTAVRHLGNYGYVRVLRTSTGEDRILLIPELLNNLAASLVLEARRNPKGLGSIEERRLLAGDYPFRELEAISAEEQEVLLDSAVLLFLKHNVCFRETDPLSGVSYLVFPELINLKKPPAKDEQHLEDDVSYSVIGPTQNVYASLVVLLGYTQTFTRTEQWSNQARYEVGNGLVCGFRQESERDGELELVLYFGKNVGQPVRSLFKGLFESFLARRNVTVFRYEAVQCSRGHVLNRAVVRDRANGGSDFAFCPECAEKIPIAVAREPIQLTQAVRGKVDEQQWFAVRRSKFEQAVFQLTSYLAGRKIAAPSCFISYAWGEKSQEKWVERDLAIDLRKAGISVILDRWENSLVGSNIPRFVERIERCDRVVVVGTPLYRTKYDNKDESTGYVVGAEVDMINNRLVGTEAQKSTVLPLLLSGEKAQSLPPLMHGKVFADFRQEREYFTTAFDLILSLYGISPGDPGISAIRDLLQESHKGGKLAHAF